jgi:hypothetical protein
MAPECGTPALDFASLISAGYPVPDSLLINAAQIAARAANSAPYLRVMMKRLLP